MPKLSIIVPVYNAESYINKCINSNISQSNKDWELILVDDGSADGSGEICDEYAQKDERVKVFHKENGGVSSARNVGLENACGEWISFVDADDWIEYNYLETLMSETANADVIFFGANFCCENNGVVKKVHNSAYAEERGSVEKLIYDLKYGAMGDVFGWTWMKFFKRSIIEEHNIKFDESIKLREDEVFTMDYCRYINSILVIDKVLYNYRIFGDGNLVNKHTDADNIALAKHIDENIQYYSDDELIKNERQRVVGYYIEKFRKEESFFNMYNAMGRIHSFLKDKPEYKQYAWDKHLMEVLSHSRFVSLLLLEIRYVLMGIHSRIY